VNDSPFLVSPRISTDIPCHNNIPFCIWSICAAHWYLQSYHIEGRQLRGISPEEAAAGFHVFTHLFLYSLHELAQTSNEIQGRAFALEKTFLLVTNWSDGEIKNDRRVFFPLRHGKLQKTRSLPARRILYK
jgi:hypothetical protein